MASDGAIVAANDRGEVFLWTDAGERRRILGPPVQGRITTLNVAPDGAIVAANDRGDVFLWTDAGKRRRILGSRVPGRITTLAVISTSVIRLSEPSEKNKLPASVRLHLPTPATIVGFGYDGIIATVHSNYKVLLWNVNGNLQKEISLHPRGFRVTAVALGPKGTVITGYHDGSVIQWSTTGEKNRFFHLPSEELVTAVAVSRDGSITAKGRSNRIFKLVGPVTAAMWVWIILLFGIVGIWFFLAPVWENVDIKQDDQVLESDNPDDQVLESDNPNNDPDKTTKSMLHLSRLIVSLIANPHTFGPLTVCINGTWGSGKTTLISLVYRELRKSYCTCVYFDAWHHQNENHLFAALAEQIRKSWRPRIKPTWPTTTDQSTSFFDQLVHSYLLIQDTVLFFMTILKERFSRSKILFPLFTCTLFLSAVLFVFLLLLGFQTLFDTYEGIGRNLVPDPGAGKIYASFHHLLIWTLWRYAIFVVCSVELSKAFCSLALKSH